MNQHFTDADERRSHDAPEEWRLSMAEPENWPEGSPSSSPHEPPIIEQPRSPLELLSAVFEEFRRPCVKITDAEVLVKPDPDFWGNPSEAHFAFPTLGPRTGNAPFRLDLATGSFVGGTDFAEDGPTGVAVAFQDHEDGGRWVRWASPAESHFTNELLQATAVVYALSLALMAVRAKVGVHGLRAVAQGVRVEVSTTSRLARDAVEESRRIVDGEMNPSRWTLLDKRMAQLRQLGVTAVAEYVPKGQQFGNDIADTAALAAAADYGPRREAEEQLVTRTNWWLKELNADMGRRGE